MVNIEAIAASLRSCSLNSGSGEVPLRPHASGNMPPPAAHAPADIGEVTVELNSEAALPFHWQQYLDLSTGELYYINLKSGERTTKDPRNAGCEAGYCSSKDDDLDTEGDGEDNDGDIEDCCSAIDGDGTDNEDFYGSSCNNCSSNSSAIASTSESSDTPESNILIAAGCKSCFMFFMVPKSFDDCPRCGGRLLRLGQTC